MCALPLHPSCSSLFVAKYNSWRQDCVGEHISHWSLTSANKTRQRQQESTRITIHISEYAAVSVQTFLYLRLINKKESLINQMYWESAPAYSEHITSRLIAWKTRDSTVQTTSVGLQLQQNLICENISLLVLVSRLCCKIKNPS